MRSGRTMPITPTMGGSLPAQGVWSAFNQARSAIIAGLTSAQVEATGWNNEVRDALLKDRHVVRSSDTVVTITLPAVPLYNITAQEVVEATIPATSVIIAQAIVATPTFTIDVSAGGITLPALLEGNMLVGGLQTMSGGM